MGDVIWHDAMQWPFEGAGWTDTARRYDRLPARAESLVDDAVWHLSRMSAGLCLRFTTDATCIHTRYDRCADTFLAAITFACIFLFWINQ